MKTLVIIPSRLAATRLPGKPLLKIRGLSIISHVFKKAEKANIGEVIVAAEDQEIINDVKHNGGQAILTGSNHKTGTDRIYEALKKIGKSDIELVMNLQGDEPLMEIDDIRHLNDQMIKNGKPVNDSNILILGITFKENCPDIRNTKVIDLIKELENLFNKCFKSR